MTQWTQFVEQNKALKDWPGGPAFERFMNAAPVEYGTIGVCLNDTGNPPQFYQFAGFIDTKTIDLVKLGEDIGKGELRAVSIELFWPLT